MDINEQRKLDIGEILRRTVSLVTLNARDVTVFVFVLGGLTALGIALTLTSTAAMEFTPELSADIPDGFGPILYDLLISVASLVAGFILMRRYLAANGRQSAGSFWVYFGMSLLSVLGIMVGLVLLIVPGIILMVRWSAASGYVISTEKGATESLGASFEATKGSSWQVFIAALILLLGLGLIGGVIGGVLGILSFTVLIYVSAFLEAFATAAFLAFGIAIYLLLTSGSEEIRDVFA